MDSALLLATSFIAGAVAHAVWQAHRGASQVGRLSKKKRDAPDSSEHGEQDSAMMLLSPSSSRSLSLPPPSPVLPPLLTPSSVPSTSLSIPTEIPLVHPYPLSAPPTPIGPSGSHLHTPGVLLTPPPEAWVAQPEDTIAKVGATDTWGEAVDYIEGHEGEHI